MREATQPAPTPYEPRTLVLGAVVSAGERQEIEQAMRQLKYLKRDGSTALGEAAREVLLAWARGLLHPINPPAGARLMPQRPVFPEGTAP